MKRNQKSVTLYFTADYAGYEKCDSKRVSSLSLADWFIERGVALKKNRKLQKVVERVITNELRFARAKSPEELKELLVAVRLMIAEEEINTLFLFFNTDYEPHSKAMRDFIVHPWFTEEERAYLKGFIQENFIDRVTLRHQINALKRIVKRRVREDKNK